jgi:hypothetical protein
MSRSQGSSSAKYFVFVVRAKVICKGTNGSSTVGAGFHARPKLAHGNGPSMVGAIHESPAPMLTCGSERA